MTELNALPVIKQERLNLILIFWNAFLTVVFVALVSYFYLVKKEIDENQLKIQHKALEQQARYDEILTAKEKELGIKPKGNDQ